MKIISPLPIANKRWLFGGAFLVALLVSLDLLSILIWGDFNVALPLPFYVYMLFFISPYSLVIIPLSYLLIFQRNSKYQNFGDSVFAFTITVFLLNTFYFYYTWEVALKSQGKLYTYIVLSENVVGFLLLLFVSYLGSIKNLKNLQYLSYLLLYILLTWCAFPVFGTL